MGNSLLYGLMGATLLALMVGVFTMLRSGKGAQNLSHKMMVTRVVLQALALAVVVALMLLGKR